jgi:polyisoprenoid-binding protein YceI
MHGKTQEVQISGTLLIAAGKITGQSTFTVKLADYQIEVPRLVKNNISETIEIRVNCLYDHSL